MPELRVLVVDDSEDNRILISRFLRSSDAVLEEAVNGLEAITKVQTGTWDLVLMDAEMPLLSGYDATRRIRAWEAEQGRDRVRIVALTAQDRASALKESAAAGCDGLLSKPLSKGTLLATLEPSADVEDLVPGYLAKRRAEAPMLKTALGNGDLESIRAAGHKMAGTGAGYGLPRITEIGRGLEAAAARSDREAIDILLEELHRI